MRFTLLGGLEIHAGVDVPSVAPKPRQVLAMLLTNSNRVVYVEDLADELWGAHRPLSYQTIVQTYIYQLRRMLGAARTEIAILSRSTGYLIEIPDRDIDAGEFERRVDQARKCLEHDAGEARELLEEAMRLWRGPALANIECGEVLSGYVARLDEVHMDALEMLIEAGLRSGHHRELVGKLKQLVLSHPFHEAFHAQLMRALSLSGRRHEAIERFRSVCDSLRTELGIDPSPFLEEAFHLALGGPPRSAGRRPGIVAKAV